MIFLHESLRCHDIDRRDTWELQVWLHDRISISERDKIIKGGGRIIEKLHSAWCDIS